MGLPEPTLPPRPHIPPPPPRQNNARFICPGIDEFLMIQKQSMVSPKEEHLDTLQGKNLLVWIAKFLPYFTQD